MKIAKMIAMAKFVATPAIATKKVPHFGSRRLLTLYGTGRAQPNEMANARARERPAR